MVKSPTPAPERPLLPAGDPGWVCSPGDGGTGGEHQRFPAWSGVWPPGCSAPLRLRGRCWWGWGQAGDRLGTGWGQEGDRSPPDNAFLQETQELMLESVGAFFRAVSIQACLGKISIGTMSKMSLISL